MGVPMPPVVVLVFCQVVSAGPADQNSSNTGWQNLEWATVHSQMQCRRQEVALMDSAEIQGADPRPFTQFDCWRAGMTLGTQYDVGHPNSRYRFWRAACPVPMVNENGDIVAWKIPECGSYDGTVVCEGDVTL